MNATENPNPARRSAFRSVVALEPRAGEALWFLDNLITVKASARNGAPFAILELEVPLGSHTPFHRHESEDEVFYVLEGRLLVFFEGGRTIECEPGSYVHTPHGTAHGFRALTPMRMLVICGTEGFAEMIRQAGGPAERRELPPAVPPDLARLEAACRANDIAILGPLPE